MIDETVNKHLNEGANRRSVDRAVDSFFKMLDSGASQQDLKGEIAWVVSELKLQASIR